MLLRLAYSLFCLNLFSVAVAAQTAPDIEAVATPPDAIVEKAATRDPRVVQQHYFLRNAEGGHGDLVAIEWLSVNPRVEGEGKLFRRELIKIDRTKHIIPERLHGVQREWHPNGKLKSESPYRMHRRDGLFRQWDEQGRLIAQYQITDGNGIERIYNSNGQLQREAVFKDNDENGPNYAFYPQTQRVLSQMENGTFVGSIFVFTGESLLEFKNRDSRGRPHGPQIQFDLRSPAQRANPGLGGGFSLAGGEYRWMVKGFDTGEAEYLKAMETDKTLLPYYKDVERYKEYVTPEIKAMLRKYMDMPRVKIPLEFDAKGEPLPAPAGTPMDTPVVGETNPLGM